MLWILMIGIGAILVFKGLKGFDKESSNYEVRYVDKRKDK